MMGWVASLRGRLGLMQGNHATGADKPDHLPHQGLRLRNVDENQPRSREIERMRGQACLARIGMQDFDVRQLAVRDKPSSPLHLLSAAFHADDPARRTDAASEKAQAALRVTTNLDHAPARRYADVIEQPLRIGGKLLSLSRQTILLHLPIA
jgi:hypothetical protein